ncbi:TonB-dependent receptor [Hallella bergensis DSM 17361]|uniref:TonB-dependent receptor n=1 Tax=Hallella bergensis DSM 17361 TaxID=585502 RepID=D1PW36_9BACT|nr:outer membrane beta-barrel protein [Hallella bergensis]EFA44390.1 TonB-dependent receptor [Hallella bergensis DSM 17361]
MMTQRPFLTFVLLFLFNLTANSIILDIVVGDTISPTLRSDSLLKKTIELDEVLVIGERKLITMRKDTTFINTNCLRVRQGANLEDLIQEIPGMEYDRNNKTLSFKGKILNGVNINGEKFMGNDIIAALENLPADAVELLKLYDMLSALEKMTGVDDGADNFVLDIKTKSSYNGSLTGSLTAEHGSQDRRKDEMQGNLFNANGENATLTIRSDNLSNTSVGKDNFQNILAGNIVKKFGKKITFNANLSLNTFHNESTSDDFYEQYLTSGTNYQKSTLFFLGKSHNHSAIISFQYNINEKTLLNVMFNGTLGNSDNLTDNTTSLYEQNSTRADTLTSGMLRSGAKGNNRKYYFSSDFTRRIGKGGASITFETSLSGSSDRTENSSLSKTRFHHLLNALGNDSVLLRNLCQQMPSRRNEALMSLRYTQPIGKQLRLQVSYGLRNEKSMNTSDTYDDAMQHLHIDSLSYESALSTLGQQIRLQMDYKGSRWKINGGINVEWQQRHISRRHTLQAVDSTVRAVEYKPMFNVKWNGRSLDMELRYSGSSQLPSIQELLTIDDKRNPLYHGLGNPNLNPSFRQQLSFSLDHQKSGLTLTGNWRNTFNDLANEVSYEENTGARTYRTVNVGGNYSVSGMLQWQKQIKRLVLSGSTGGSFQNHVYFLNEQTQGNSSKCKTHIYGNSISIRGSYQPKWGSIDLHGSLQTSRSHNLLTDIRVNTFDYDFGVSGTIDIPHDVQIWGDANGRLHRGTYAVTDDDQWLLNIGASWRFLKKKQATLSFKWNDILNRRTPLMRSVTEYGYHESYRPQIRSYVLLSLRYRFSISKRKSEGNHHK